MGEAAEAFFFFEDIMCNYCLFLYVVLPESMKSMVEASRFGAKVPKFLYRDEVDGLLHSHVIIT